MQKSQKVRRAISMLGFSGFRTVNGQRFRNALAGRPLLFLQQGVTDSLPGRGLDEEYWGRPLRELVWQRGIGMYVTSRQDMPRRIILVSALAAIPDDLRLAAVFLGARVQEELLVPALHFAPLARHTFACTQHFQRTHAGVMAVIRGAAARAVVPGTARIRLRTPVQFVNEYDRMSEKSKVRQRRHWTFLYEAIADVELANASDAVKEVSRSLPEFMRACVSMRQPDLP